MKTLLDINKLLRKKFTNEEDFFELDEEKRNYYIGWYEGLDFIKNVLKYDEKLAHVYVDFMLGCVEKKMNLEYNAKANDFSFGWLEGYFESLKWFLD